MTKLPMKYSGFENSVSRPPSTLPQGGEQIKRSNDLQDYIAQQTTHITEFDESLVRRWIKQINIWDDHITVELKSGVSIDVDA